MRNKLPSPFFNWISLIGLTIALISLFMILFLFIISFFFNRGGSYLGVVMYMILPVFLTMGAILIPVGMYLTFRRNKKKEPGQSDTWPKVDLNIVRHRNGFMVFVIGTAVFLMISAVGSYEAFHFTESVEFCGKTCHNIMIPEYTAYQNSPHAKVACVECHVGAGAGWYVKSKMSGLYQVYTSLMNIYPRPIETPIKNLRPARETCEQCHWPQKFYARQLRIERHYLADSANTEWDINLVMKIGANLSALGLQEGIHWHINPDTKIEYSTSDEKREVIPWVKYTNIKTGKSVVFKSTEGQGKGSTSEVRTMECIDCHNRPSHNYQPPTFFINNAITAGFIPKSLPNIKATAMDILGKKFSTTDSSLNFIKSEVTKYYQTNYPQIYAGNGKIVQQAISGIQNAFSQNIFPEMKVRWDVYPNNIGHLQFNGCFRCHDGKHVSPEGRVISKDCNLCHTITAQGTLKDMQTGLSNAELEFKHPADVGDSWKEMLCTECHTGLNP
ncbi:MAG: NapC/NirT family cytochrome c [Ignavibacteria bacterium]